MLTSVNQCHAKGPVVLWDGKARQELERGSRTVAGPAWVHHDGVTYVFPEPAKVVAQAQAQSGSWRAINAAYDDKPISLDVFSLWIDHGSGPAGGSYRYVVAPDLPAEKASGYARKLPVEVLSNTGEVQAVRHAGLRVLQAAFYAPGRVAPKRGPSLAVDAPCLVMLREQAGGVLLAVSNPENRPLTVTVEVGRRLEGDGCTWVADQGVARVRVELPDGVDAGKSIVLRLETGGQDRRQTRRGTRSARLVPLEERPNGS